MANLSLSLRSLIFIHTVIEFSLSLYPISLRTAPGQNTAHGHECRRACTWATVRMHLKDGGNKPGLPLFAQCRVSLDLAA